LRKKNKIKSIIFDFGGVLLDIDFDRMYQAMSRLLKVPFSPDHLPANILPILYQFETGHLNVETFIWNVQRLSTKEMPQGKEVIDAWNSMLLGWNPAKFDLLLRLRKNYSLYLLSNTNELHMDWVYNDLKKKHNIIDFDKHYFDKTYYSHIIGMRKPNSEIFSFVTEDTGIDPGSTLFIDDFEENIDAAKKAGWQTYHHNPKDDLASIMANKLGI
jgi:putative hydrolase of the HAD superfamily